MQAVPSPSPTIGTICRFNVSPGRLTDRLLVHSTVQDVAFISEANLLSTVPMEVQHDLIERSIASIRIWIPRKGRKLFFGGVYREHKCIGNSGPIGDRSHQELRWRMFVEQWKRADTAAETFVIGDNNVDKLKWDAPDQEIAPLVDIMKEEIETKGYVQLVRNATRFWVNTQDLLVDQFWTQHPDRISQCRNISRSVGDHNTLEVTLRIKGHNRKAEEIIKRDWRATTSEEIRSELGRNDCNLVYKEEYLILAYSALEEHLCEVIDRLFPNKKIQMIKKHKNWVSKETRHLIEERETAKEFARFTRDQEDWNQYRTIRNRFTLKCKKD